MSSAASAEGKGNGLRWVGTRAKRPDGVDKVTGRAKYGADFSLPNMLVGKVLRSPHPHARIRSLDTSRALALAGVKAVVTAADFPDIPSALSPFGEVAINFRDVSCNVMARDKVLYEGHAVAAVAATNAAVARRALKLIEVDYELLPHVLDPVAAMAADAPLLHEDMITSGVEPAPEKPSNVAKRVEFGHGDVEVGFAQADIIVEREFNTRPVHQGYIEPHACLASVSEDGQSDLWVSTQGHFSVRALCARLLGWEVSAIRVVATEIGGGFGGKTVVYLEPLSLALSAKAAQPVKMVMTREEVFRATGPTSGARVRVKVGVTKDGRIRAADAELTYQAGAFPGSPVQPGAMTAFAPYNLENVRTVGYDVVVNRPKVAAYRAPGAPIAEYAVECVIDEVAQRLDLDPIDFRLKNAARDGTLSSYGPTFGTIGLVATLEAMKAHDHYRAPLGANQARGVACGFWFNIGGETCANMNVTEDGTITLVTGTPDIGGSRASVAMQAAEALGISPDSIRSVIADTSQLGYTFVTGGSRVTFSSGMAAVEAARDVITQVRERAAKIWDIPIDAVEWIDGSVRPAGANAGDFEPMTLGDIAGSSAKTGGPIVGKAAINAQGAGPSFGAHIVDLEVDADTGRTEVVRYTALQDAGKAVHPSYVEGQMQGGAVQGIGWALNEEYVYGEDGRLENAGFLDYRMPVASDLPMIDTFIVEVPNPGHPYGVRGVGETPIIPPMAAIANAMERATGIRFTELPMSPPRVRKAMSDAEQSQAAE